MKSTAGVSLKRRLLLWLLPVLVGASAVGIWSSNHLLSLQAQQAYDRALAGVVQAIDLNISTTTGGLALTQPYQLLDIFELTASGNVYYSISTEDGLAQIGHAAMPMPATMPPQNQVHFFDALYMGNEPVRVAMLVRAMDPPLLAHGENQRIIVQVAESLQARERYTRELLWQVALQDVLVMLIVITVVVAGIEFSFMPLSRLLRNMQHRNDDDLSPIVSAGLPTEVTPLVASINRHMARFASHAQLQRQFLDDASHQLRTPLATLRTNVEYALRERDAMEMRSALQAMLGGLERAERVTNQMLALAKVHGASIGAHAFSELQDFDLGALLEESVRMMLPAARDKRLDYGIDRPTGQAMPMRGMRLLLQEALLNVLDNAIKYTPAHGSVLASISREGARLRVSVQDSGPGMSEDDMRQAGTRFRRGRAGRNTSGAGLGLAIVDAIVKAHHGTMRLHNLGSAACGADAAATPDSGLRVDLEFEPAPARPLPTPDASSLTRSA
ncbi:sensor histidine kinase [Lampropedia cohaerens]|uniref:sensor histidine kinase n=1 Tax=Lampropedia cohaerens TaxID=1610491 RepID=UPI00069AD1F7|nr:sensor histidine kinase [Lampropedia cohaerens]